MKAFEDSLAEWTVQDSFYERTLGPLREKILAASLRSREQGCAAGIPLAGKVAQALGVEGSWKKQNGDWIQPDEEIARFRGKAEQILKLENLIIGLIGKPSGIATAAWRAKEAAQGQVRLICGGWKKHPFLIKEMAREAVAAGGLESRILPLPFLYLDKNFVRVFGGVRQALEAVASHSVPKVIQVRGEFGPLAEEAREAVRHGARVIMVDTGCCEDIDEVLRVVGEEKATPRVLTAFAGGIKIEEISRLVQKGVDILDIGAAILDAPWLELSYDVVTDPKSSFNNQILKFK
jgi:nicotinate-nucleotide pyrophosphorylase (carboxylating)